MGGRASSGGFRSGGGVASVKDGKDRIELEHRLRYGSNDAGITDRQRSKLEEFEKKHYNDKEKEHITIVGTRGDKIHEAEGRDGAADLPYWLGTEGSSWSHSHNRGKGMLGGTFSPADIDRGFTGEKVKKFNNMRAVAKEGTYSITKGKNFDGKGLSEYYKKEHARENKAYNDRLLQIEQNKNAGAFKGSKGRNEYVRQRNAAFNDYVINLHESLIRGQRKYGYNYTLERRRSK